MFSMSDKKCSEPNWYLTIAIQSLTHRYVHTKGHTYTLKPHIDIF